jgi:hypothetical protein
VDSFFMGNNALYHWSVYTLHRMICGRLEGSRTKAFPSETYLVACQRELLRRIMSRFHGEWHIIQALQEPFRQGNAIKVLPPSNLVLKGGKKAGKIRTRKKKTSIKRDVRSLSRALVGLLNLGATHFIDKQSIDKLAFKFLHGPNAKAISQYFPIDACIVKSLQDASNKAGPGMPIEVPTTMSDTGICDGAFLEWRIDDYPIVLRLYYLICREDIYDDAEALDIFYGIWSGTGVIPLPKTLRGLDHLRQLDALRWPRYYFEAPSPAYIERQREKHAATMPRERWDPHRPPLSPSNRRQGLLPRRRELQCRQDAVVIRGQYSSSRLQGKECKAGRGHQRARGNTAGL